MGELNKVIYGLVYAGRCWKTKVTDDLNNIGFEQSHADLRIFRKIGDNKVDRVIVIHADDVLAESKHRKSWRGPLSNWDRSSLSRT